MKGVIKKDLSGMICGLLTVVSHAGQNSYGQSLWHCKCKCGTVKVLGSVQLRRGQTRSCGCERYSTVRKHGRYLAPEYRSWAEAKSRCFNPKKRGFKYWGGRGITMCDRWKNCFAAFFEDMGPRPAGTTLDRIDNDGNYEPGNCRWATRDQQSANQRRRGQAA